jgi:hypothetical protein
VRSKSVASLRECRCILDIIRLSVKAVIGSSIYQDIPLYSEENFMDKAPEDLRTEEVLTNEHSLMLNRLNFELAERQR